MTKDLKKTLNKGTRFSQIYCSKPDQLGNDSKGFRIRLGTYLLEKLDNFSFAKEIAKKQGLETPKYISQRGLYYYDILTFIKNAPI